MSHFLLTLAGAVAVIAAAGGAHLGVNAKAQLPRCSLYIDERGDSIHVRAMIASETQMNGAYEMTLRRNAPAGTIDLSQSGAFALGAGERTALNDATLNGRARELDAGLSIRTAGRTLRCPVLVNGILQEEI